MATHPSSMAVIKTTCPRPQAHWRLCRRRFGRHARLASNADHTDTKEILANPAMANTTVFGYVNLGVSTQNLSISQMETDIFDWKGMGVKGIFLR